MTDFKNVERDFLIKAMGMMNSNQLNQIQDELVAMGYSENEIGDIDGEFYENLEEKLREFD